MSNVKKSAMKTMAQTINKARTEEMSVFISGSPLTKGFIVVHEEKAYNVITNGKEIVACDCPHHVYNSAICKHMIKVSLEKGIDISEERLA